MKKGYTLVDYGNISLHFDIEKRECEFKGLIRQGQSKPCAIMMIYRRTDVKNGQVYNICIPSAYAPEGIWKQTLNVLHSDIAGSNNNSMMQTVIWALMKFGSEGYTT